MTNINNYDLQQAIHGLLLLCVSVSFSRSMFADYQQMIRNDSFDPIFLSNYRVHSICIFTICLLLQNHSDCVTKTNMLTTLNCLVRSNSSFPDDFVYDLVFKGKFFETIVFFIALRNRLLIQMPFLRECRRCYNHDREKTIQSFLFLPVNINQM